MLVIRPQQLWLSGFRTPLLEILLWEVSHPRPGATSVIERLLEVVIIQGFRAELTSGFWSAPGWLGALTDPVLRTGFNDARLESPPKSVKELASEVHRSMRRVRARVRTQSGDGPGRLLRQLRIQRALQRLERGTPRLDELAREIGYVNVSSFCRAFRREVGCTPAQYWRRVKGRPFPRRHGT